MTAKDEGCTGKIHSAEDCSVKDLHLGNCQVSESSIII